MHAFVDTFAFLDVHRSTQWNVVKTRAKTYFILKVVEAFSISFGCSHYILTWDFDINHNQSSSATEYKLHEE